jgi:methionyl-tRNA formyltransferase
MHFKKVLLISDNREICSRINDFVINHERYDEISVVFGTSPYSSAADFRESLNREVLTIDLRKQDDIGQILEDYDLVISVHCKQLFPSTLVNGVQCINIHPGYNPINRGWYPQVFAIINDLPVGATIHETDEKIDHGAIIARKFVDKHLDDTSLSLYDRIVDAEIELFKAHFISIMENSYSTIVPEKEGELYLKKDFNELLEIDLREKVTFQDAIDKLRALTHGSYENAYFIDPETGDKIYLSLSLRRESKES